MLSFIKRFSRAAGDLDSVTPIDAGFRPTFGGRKLGGKHPLLQPVVGAVETAADSDPIELVEVAGRIKWFDVSKGYGFIVPDDGSGDALAARDRAASRRFPDRLLKAPASSARRSVASKA